MKIHEILTTEKLIEILDLTIKKDNVNKLITFLAMLSAYTEDSQINISFNAPSSSGKSYIPLEICKLFPKEDVVKLANVTPNAFYHEQGEYDAETNTVTLDLSHKIIIFLDQQSTLLLTKLRSLLSHDDKVIQSKITDKNNKGGNRTKTVNIIGFPVVIYCTASLNLDEQEATRFLLLSPEISEDKIKQAIYEKVRKDSHKSAYEELVEDDPMRVELMERIKSIKDINIQDIRIGASKQINDNFFKRVRTLKPRHSRDIARILNLVKVFALLNVWDKELIDGALYADERDVESAFELWDKVSESQELNLPPYVYNLFQDVFLTAYIDKNNGLEGFVNGIGITKQDIMQKHFEVYGRFIPDWLLRLQIIPLLETAGLITQEPDPTDKRKTLLFPFSKNNSENDSGVTINPNQNKAENANDD